MLTNAPAPRCSCSFKSPYAREQLGAIPWNASRIVARGDGLCDVYTTEQRNPGEFTERYEGAYPCPPELQAPPPLAPALPTGPIDGGGLVRTGPVQSTGPTSAVIPVTPGAPGEATPVETLPGAVDAVGPAEPIGPLTPGAPAAGSQAAPGGAGLLPLLLLGGALLLGS